MNIFNSIKKKVALSAVAVFAGLFAFAPAVAAIPYDPNSQGLSQPGFNVYAGTPYYGNENDFLQGKEKGASTYTDPVNSACNNGQQFALRTYVHNGANPAYNNNGSGQGVAHGTKVKVALPGVNEASSFNINSTISASNASSVSDGLVINCGSKKVKLSYVAGSAYQYSTLGGNHALSDSIVTTGAAIGTHSPNGDVWGCWDQRVYVFITVEVKEVPKEEPKKSLGECKLLKVQTESNRKVTADISTTVENAQIIGYKIDWGDGTTSNKQSDSHTYAKDGTYTITAHVLVKFHDGKQEWKTANACKMKVTFKPGQPPVVVPPETPKELPKTGAASTAAIFVVITAASTLGYYWYNRRNSLV